jgi:uncharacterized Zn ribbon protein
MTGIIPKDFLNISYAFSNSHRFYQNRKRTTVSFNCYSNIIEKRSNYISFSDAPPPYTPSDNGSSSSHSVNQNETPQRNEASSSTSNYQATADPPHYDTIREQPGFLGSTSRDQKSSGRSQNFNPMGPHGGPFQIFNPMGPHGVPSQNFNPMGPHGSRSQHLNPISSALDLAGNIIGTTANIAFGITGAAHGAAAQVTRQASTSAAYSAKQALGAVGDFVNNRREEKQKAKSLRREQRRERREMKREARGNWGSWGGCSSSNEQPFACSSRSSVPFSHPGFGYNASSSMNTADHDSSSISSSSSSSSSTTNNVDKLEMKKSNSPLELPQSWSGKYCHLKTSNGPLTVRGSLTATDSIDLENSNGQMVVDGTLISRNDIRVKSSNGAFIVHGDSIIAKDLQVHMSNAPLHLKSFIEAKRIELKTKNAPVIIGNIAVGSELYVKTSNSPIEIHIASIASRSAHIEIESSNAPVSVYLPSDFSGYFNVKSNFIGSASVVAKSNESIVLKYDTNESSKKSGSCKNSSNKSDVDITIKTSNASATLYI